MTRLEAIRHIRQGKRIEKEFHPARDGVVQELEVWLQYSYYCDFPRRAQYKHKEHGPIHVRFWSGANPHWIHISAKQLLGFIKRNYSR